jgi:hypothetical protein
VRAQVSQWEPAAALARRRAEAAALAPQAEQEPVLEPALQSAAAEVPGRRQERGVAQAQESESQPVSEEEAARARRREPVVAQVPGSESQPVPEAARPAWPQAEARVR